MKNSEIKLGMILKLPENKVPIYEHETGAALDFLGGQSAERVMVQLANRNTIPFFSKDLKKA